MALAGRDVHPEVLRSALRLAHGAEAQSVARAARVASLARALLARVPEDAGAALALAQSLAQTGETREAIAGYARVESMAPRSPAAAEAQRSRFALAEPLAWQEVESVLRGATRDKAAGSLDALSVRARRLAAEHPVWPAWLAVGVVERRRGAFAAAREALTTGLDAGEGAPEVHRELARACAALGDASGALRHAEQALTLGGESPAALGALAEALFVSGRRTEGDAALARAQALAPEDVELREIAAGVRAKASVPPRPSAWGALLSRLRR
jgi:tetratricopeptide (TPR) repeat protein